MPALMNTTSDEEESISTAHVPEGIREVMHIAYRIILPIFIMIVLAISMLNVAVLHRPSFRGTLLKKYFLLLASADILYTALNIINVVTLNRCEVYDSSFALYVVSVAYTLLYIVQTFSLYIILWISYNRFLAIWDFKRFQEIQTTSVLLRRLMFTVVLCILVNLGPCSSRESFGNYTVFNNTESYIFANTDQSLRENSNPFKKYSYTCEGGSWIIIDGIDVEANEIWVRVLFWVRGIISYGVPLVLVIIFNTLYIIGRHRQMSQSTSSTTRTRQRDMTRLYITLSISFTLVVCTTPYMVFTTFFSKNTETCHGSFFNEIFRAACILLLLMEHVMHIVFFCNNEIFRSELESLLSSGYLYLRSAPLKSPLLERCSTSVHKNEDEPEELSKVEIP